MKRVFLLIVILAATGVYWTWARSHNEISDRIAVSGNIELREYQVSFKIGGRLAEIAVNEGDTVRKGDLLARIAPEQLEQSRDREAAALRAAELQLLQMKTGVDYQREANAGEYELREAELRQAQAQLNQLLAGSRPQEIQQASLAVEEGRSQHQQASSDWERAERLFKSDDISRAQYEQYRTRFESTRASLRQAEQRLALITEGPRKEDIEMARAQVARAQAALKLAAALRLSLVQRQQEIDTRRAEAERARLNVAVFNTQVGDTSVYAPADGVVLVKAAELGEVINAGASILTIGAMAEPWLRGYIPETELGRVKIGQKVRLSTDSYGGKEYWGRVSFIASEAEFTPKQIQTKDERVKLVYRVKIDIANPAHELKSNMPVDGEILAGSENPLGVPPSVLEESDRGNRPPDASRKDISRLLMNLVLEFAAGVRIDDSCVAGDADLQRARGPFFMRPGCESARASLLAAVEHNRRRD